MTNINTPSPLNRDDVEYYGDYYDSEELGEEIAALRPRGPEGRTTWVYLAILGLLFVVLAVTSWACSDGSDTASPFTDVSGSVATSVLTMAVDSDIITIRGSVPDQETRDGVHELAANYYEEARIIDAITVDPDVALEGGSIRVSGEASADDERPDQLKQDVIDRYGLSDGGTELQLPGSGISPSAIEVNVSPDALVMTGAVPDEAASASLEAAGRAFWPANGVDVAGLQRSDQVTLDGATIRLSGNLLPGDDRAVQLAAQLEETFGSEVTVDMGGVTIDESGETLEAVEDELVELLQAEPILFAPQSAEIEPVSDAVLQTIATKLNQVPSARVEIVGHTDDLGPDDENLTLSIQRAEAVEARLIELEVDPSRLSTRGEGEAQPLVDEDTAEAREQNRRIEFNLVAS